MNTRSYPVPGDIIDEKTWIILVNTMKNHIFTRYVINGMVEFGIDLVGFWDIPGESLMQIVYLCLGFSIEERFSQELVESNEELAEYIGEVPDLPDTETRLIRGELDLSEDAVWSDIRDRIDKYTNRLKNPDGTGSEDFDDVAYQCALELYEAYLGDGWRARYRKK